MHAHEIELYNSLGLGKALPFRYNGGMATLNPKREETINELKRLKSEGSYDAMLALAQKAALAFPYETKIWNLLHYAQGHYVNEKIESQIVKQLEEKNDYTSLVQIYLKLLTIFPESKQVKKMLQKSRKKIQEGRENEMKTYYENAKTKIEEMIKKGDYESAIQASYEILEEGTEDKAFPRLLVRAEDLLDRQMNQELERIYQEMLPALMAEYKEHKDQFIRI